MRRLVILVFDDRVADLVLMVEPRQRLDRDAEAAVALELLDSLE